jgi:hypothetical protein
VTNRKPESGEEVSISLILGPARPSQNVVGGTFIAKLEYPKVQEIVRAEPGYVEFVDRGGSTVVSTLPYALVVSKQLVN